jgi:hypothetical protein
MWHLQCCSVCLDYSRSFVLPPEFSGLFFNLGYECHWNFGGDCIEHVDCFGNIAISTILILPINVVWDLSIFCSLTDFFY